jgi:hypothetical protein
MNPEVINSTTIASAIAEIPRVLIHVGQRSFLDSAIFGVILGAILTFILDRLPQFWKFIMIIFLQIVKQL